MSVETIVVVAVGYVAILVVVLSMLAAAGRADRAAGRDAGGAEPESGARRGFRPGGAEPELARSGPEEQPEEELAPERSAVRHPTR